MIKKVLVFTTVTAVVGAIGILFAVTRLVPNSGGITADLSKSSPTSTTMSSAAGNQDPNPGLSEYHNISQSISFRYPSKLLLISSDQEGNAIYPKLFFSSDQAKLVPSMYDFASCASYSGVDCISVFAFVAPGSNEYRIPDSLAGGFDGTFYIYPDIAQNKPFLLNGTEAVRYYAIDTKTPDPAIPTRIQERLYVKDPYIPGRIILLNYQEDKKVSPILLGGSPSGAMIANLFDPTKKQSFETIANSFTITPTDTLRVVTESLPMLGIAFQYPAYWGALEYSDPSPDKPESVPTPEVNFHSPLFSGDVGTPTALQFDIENSSTVGSFSEGMHPPLFDYAGQALDSVCEQRGYVDTTAYDFIISGCFVKATEGGANIALVTGTYASTSVAAILFPTTSKLWPGMTIFAESKDSSAFNQDETILARMADSLSYLR